MREMFSKKQIEEMIKAESISEEEVEELISESVEGKFVRVIAPPSSSTLTEEEIEIFSGGVFINGEFLGYKNPVFFPTHLDGTTHYGVCIVTSPYLARYIICEYSIASNGTIGVLASGTRYLQLANVGQFNGKNIPAYPSDTGTFVLKMVDGTLTWVEEV